MRAIDDDLTRRDFVGIGLGAAALSGATVEAEAATPSNLASCSLTINGQRHDLWLEPRVTLLDLLRERLGITGTKKGCDHGQCGACTVLSDGLRINSCLTLALTQEGRQITTIEGLAHGSDLHPLQAAFIEHDAFQCGFCTSGQICSGVGLLRELQPGTQLSDAEIRERMSGNLCRCGAYPNIVAALRAAHGMGEASRRAR